jgi:Flp pilus assembly pilin Flp
MVENQPIRRLTIGVRVGIISCTSFQVVFTLGSGGSMVQFFRNIWTDERGQDIAEYAVMLAVILVLVIGTVRLIGTNANNVFSSVASSIPQ